MIKLIYKVAKPYIYPNFAKRAVLESSEFAEYSLNQSLKVTHPFKPGWYMVELKATGAFETAYLDMAFEKNDSLPLPIRAKKLIKRIIYLKNQGEYLKLNLVINGKNGSLSLLRFVPIKEDFALARMLKRLSDHPLLNKEVLLAKFNKKATVRQIDFNQVVFEAYNRIFCNSNDDTYHQWIEDVELDLIDKFNSTCSERVLIEDYVCIVDPSYVLYESSKDLLIRFLAKHPDAVLAYPDEDNIGDHNIRSKPWFKTDWNHDLFLSQDYISTCFVCRKTWYEENKSIFESLEVSLALATILPNLTSKEILHLPLVLAHKLLPHKSSGDEALDAERAHVLKGTIVNLTSVGLTNKNLVLNFLMPNPEPLVSLIIPTRNRLNILKPCVESILEKTTYGNFEILILDNQSTDKDILEWFESIHTDQRVRVLHYDHAFNYSAINNFGVQQAHGSVIGLINNDVEVISANWLTEMVAHACRTDIGCVGAKLYYSNGQIQHAGVILGLGHVAGHAHRFAEREAEGYFNRLNLVQNYSAVTGACLLVRREIYEQVGGLNEHALSVAYNDVDFCLRVRKAGYRNLWTPHAELYHHESVSRGEDDTPEKKARFAKEVAYMRTTWAEELKNDPCYNPNLSKLREDFSLREF